MPYIRTETPTPYIDTGQSGHGGEEQACRICWQGHEPIHCQSFWSLERIDDDLSAIEAKG